MVLIYLYNKYARKYNMLNTNKLPYNNINNIPKNRGIYATWLNNECIYVGKSSKLHNRIKSHYSGQRGSDQFCLYVFDSYIKTSLDGKGAQISKKLNYLTQQWTRDNLTFSYFECDNDTEEEIYYRKSMQPTLNPL